MKTDQIENTLDTGMFIAGFLVGLIGGGIAALFKVPQSGQQTRQQISATGDNIINKIESVVPSDPIAEGLAEGKAAARRRQSELGLG
ncbi:MAG: YtxH domain-containing protein [Chloroflexi bacterium]|nr:YtxH domain-containing protein [Chloroflexota bacterium]